MIPYIWAHEIFQDYFLDPLANMVLYPNGNSYFGDVSIFGRIDIKRKMVSLLFYNGSDLG